MSIAGISPDGKVGSVCPSSAIGQLQIDQLPATAKASSSRDRQNARSEFRAREKRIVMG